jgi:hypothetical protein
MKDRFGRDMAVYVVSAKVERGEFEVKLKVTLVLRGQDEMRKTDVNKSVWGKNGDVLSTISESEFGAKTEQARQAVAWLLEDDPRAGKFFLKEAVEAYNATAILTPEQIHEAVAGALLVSPVSDL